LHNGHEYLEGMLGAWKARAAAINVNYRYVAAELAYVLADSGARAVIYHGAFAATLAEVLPGLPAVGLLLQVDDGSGAALLPGAGGRGPRGTPGPPPPPARRPGSPPPTATCSTPAAPPASPRARCGARATSWPPRSASRARPPRSWPRPPPGPACARCRRRRS